MKISHPFEPVVGEDSKILILGTMPSPASRDQGFYYGHARNRFWQVLAGVLKSKEPEDNLAKRNMMIENRIALWDVLAECEIAGADDSSIRNPKTNDIAAFMAKHGINHVFANGKTAGKLLRKTGIEPVVLPSTSPANARMDLEALIAEWKVICDFLS